MESIPIRFMPDLKDLPGLRTSPLHASAAGMPGRATRSVACRPVDYNAPKRILSLFSGCGSVEVAALLLGHAFKVVGWVEKDPVCRALLKELLPGVWNASDITTKGLAGRLPKADIWDVSMAGNRALMDGVRTSLIDVVFDMIDSMDDKPATLLMENVLGLCFWKRGAEKQCPVLVHLLNRLRQSGYKTVAWRKLAAEGFGVPCTRDRIFICAQMDGDARDILLPSDSLCCCIDCPDGEQPCYDCHAHDLRRRTCDTDVSFCIVEGDCQSGPSIDSTPTFLASHDKYVVATPGGRFGYVSLGDACRMMGFSATHFGSVTGAAAWHMLGNSVNVSCFLWLLQALENPYRHKYASGLGGEQSQDNALHLCGGLPWTGNSGNIHLDHEPHKQRKGDTISQAGWCVVGIGCAEIEATPYPERHPYHPLHEYCDFSAGTDEEAAVVGFTDYVDKLATLGRAIPFALRVRLQAASERYIINKHINFIRLGVPDGMRVEGMEIAWSLHPSLQMLWPVYVLRLPFSELPRCIARASAVLQEIESSTDENACLVIALPLKGGGSSRLGGHGMGWWGGNVNDASAWSTDTSARINSGRNVLSTTSETASKWLDLFHMAVDDAPALANPESSSLASLKNLQMRACDVVKQYNSTLSQCGRCTACINGTAPQCYDIVMHRNALVGHIGSQLTMRGADLVGNHIEVFFSQPGVWLAGEVVDWDDTALSYTIVFDDNSTETHALFRKYVQCKFVAACAAEGSAPHRKRQRFSDNPVSHPSFKTLADAHSADAGWDALVEQQQLEQGDAPPPGLSDTFSRSLSIACMGAVAFGPLLIDHPRIVGRVCVPWSSLNGAATPFVSAYGLFDGMRHVRDSRHDDFYRSLYKFTRVLRSVVISAFPNSIDGWKDAIGRDGKNVVDSLIEISLDVAAPEACDVGFGKNALRFLMPTLLSGQSVKNGIGKILVDVSDFHALSLDDMRSARYALFRAINVSGGNLVSWIATGGPLSVRVRLGAAVKGVKWDQRGRGWRHILVEVPPMDFL